MTRIVAYVPDLMDRSRFAAVAEITFVDGPDDLFADPSVEVELWVVDLGRPGVLAALAGAPDGARVTGYASHVDRELVERAEALGVEVHSRSRFFTRLGELLR